MNKRLLTVVLIDSNGMASQSVEDAWKRLNIAYSLRILSSCTEARAFLRHRSKLSEEASGPDVAALIIDHSAGQDDGLELIENTRGCSATRSIPILVYAADIKSLRKRPELVADAFVRRPMALKLVQALDSLCGLTMQARGLSARLRDNGTARRSEPLRKEVVINRMYSDPRDGSGEERVPANSDRKEG